MCGSKQNKDQQFVSLLTLFFTATHYLPTGLAGPTNQKNILSQHLQSTAVLASAPAYNLSLVQRQLLKTVALAAAAAAQSLVLPSPERPVSF